MATLVSYDLNGKKLSFANWISNLSGTDTPFVSMTGKEAVNQTLFQWQSDSLGPVVDNAVQEGSEAADGVLRTTKTHSNYTQILRKVVKVSDTANALANYGRGRELQYQMEKAGKEIKRDLELILLSDQDKDAGVPYAEPRRTACFQALVAAINEADEDTGAIVHKSTGDSGLSETALWDITYNLYLSGSDADTIMFHPKHAKFFASLMETTSGTRVRMFDGPKDNKVSIYVTEIIDPLGNTYKLVPNGKVPEDAIYFFNPKDWTQMVLRTPERIQLGKDGSYEKWMIEMEVGLRHRHPYASGVLIVGGSNPEPEPKTKLSLDKSAITLGFGGQSIGKLVNESDASSTIVATHEDGSTVTATSSNPSVVTVDPATATGRSRAAKAAVFNQFVVKAVGAGTSTITFTDGTDTVTCLVTSVESDIDITAIPDMYPTQTRTVTVTGASSSYTIESTNTDNIVVLDQTAHTIQCKDAHDAEIHAIEEISGIKFYGSAYVTCDNIHIFFEGKSDATTLEGRMSSLDYTDRITYRVGESGDFITEGLTYKYTPVSVPDGGVTVTGKYVDVNTQAADGTVYVWNIEIDTPAGVPFVPAKLSLTVQGGADYIYKGIILNPADMSTLFQDIEGTVPVTANGQTVRLVKDISGNGYAATTASADTSPTYKDGKLVFDGVNDYLILPKTNYYASNGDIMAFAQVNVTGTPTASKPFSIIDDDDGVNRFSQLLTLKANPVSTIFFSNGGTATATATTASTSVKNLGVSVVNYGTPKFEIKSTVNGVVSTSTGPTITNQKVDNTLRSLEVGRRKNGTQYAKFELGRLEITSSVSSTKLNTLCETYK